ncbi:MAG: hypothetical protein ACRYFV_22680 [Janthinobacterium lividum]
MIQSLPIGLHTYFENAVGKLLEHPFERYITVEYHTGPRQLGELQAFLSHAGQLLAQHGWDQLHSAKGMMAAFTADELVWIIDYWSTKTHRSTDLYSAMLLPHDVFARLSWKGTSSII